MLVVATRAEALELTKKLSLGVRDAVTKIYQGLAQVEGNRITLKIVKPNQRILKIYWPAEAFTNCHQNIEVISSLDDATKEIIPRVNPNTYQALLEAAFEMDLDEIVISSGWRPMLGSVLHRLGIGLDVKSIKLNGAGEQFSRTKTQPERDYANAVKERKVLEKKNQLNSSEKERLNLLKSTEPIRLNQASESIRANENHSLSQFTRSLRSNGEVLQTFDPWEMDYNTSKSQTPTLNRLSDGNETLHSNHLHITVFDLELGHGK